MTDALAYTCAVMREKTMKDVFMPLSLDMLQLLSISSRFIMRYKPAHVRYKHI